MRTCRSSGCSAEGSVRGGLLGAESLALGAAPGLRTPG